MLSAAVAARGHRRFAYGKTKFIFHPPRAEFRHSTFGFSLMRQHKNRYLKRKLLPVSRTSAFPLVAVFVRAEAPPKPAPTHHRHKIALIKQPLELNVARLI